MTNSEIIRATLKEIYDEHEGKISPELVVEAAQDPESPLHKLFEWDLEKAAHRWHIRTAQKILSYKYTEITETTTITAVAYVRDPRCAYDEGGYVSVEHVKSEKDLARKVLLMECARIDASLERSRELAHFFDLGAEMEEFEGKIEGWREKIRDDVPPPVVQ